MKTKRGKKTTTPPPSVSSSMKSKHLCPRVYVTLVSKQYAPTCYMKELRTAGASNDNQNKTSQAKQKPPTPTTPYRKPNNYIFLHSINNN